ncbi:MAG: late competence development ComFB family protein [Lachnospiraceae bacterium]|nr:late competence development ComFB family protein [Lachnospiraceae bacterium]
MEFVLRNMTEGIVLKKLNLMKESLDCCTCEHCLLDIASYALNRLPAKYVATTQGELLSRLDSLEPQYDATVMTVILQGAILVKDHPRHE